MEWTSITTAISLGVIAICSIVIVGLLWRKYSPAMVRIERVITWITFLVMLISLGLLTTYEVPDKSVKVEFSLIASVLAILVTVLVGWQVWQALISREQIRDMETRIKDIEQNLVDKITKGIADYDIENQAQLYYVMGRSTMQVHGAIEAINKTVPSIIHTDLINISFWNIGFAMQLLKAHPNSKNYKLLYNALTSTIQACEDCEKSLQLIEIANIDRLINAVRSDNEFREGFDKDNIVSRLEKIKTSVAAIKASA